MAAHRVVVVGAGIGGLTAGLLLAARGCDVVICERAASPGGKVRQVQAGGAGIDAGPTVFTMRWVFDELLDGIGRRFDDVATLKPATVLARHAWNHDERLDLFADIDRSEAAIAAFAGAREAQGFRTFCRAARQTYEALQRTFLSASQPSMPGLVGRLGLRGLGKFTQSSPFATLAAELAGHFHDPRLRQLFGRYATYVGSSPFACPATLMLIAHVEQEGVWLVDGGMYALGQGLARLATQMGAKIRTRTHVEEIMVAGGRATGVRLADGESIAADAVVFNGDAAALAAGLVGTHGRRALQGSTGGERSLSAMTWVMHARATGFPLVRHTVFFSPDTRTEFDDLFKSRRMPAAPTVYVCAQDRPDHDRPDQDGLAPVVPERLLCLVNAPATGDAHPSTANAQWTSPEEIAACRARMSNRLAACGLSLHPESGAETVTTPRDFDSLFPGSGGALYGRASHGWMASFQRPGSRTKLAGLFLAGGSVHPGAGVPMAALSGRLAAESALKDLTSIRPFHRVATRGGTSTG